MFPEDKCEHCPLIARNQYRPCLAQVTKHRRYCHHAEQGNQGYINLLLDEYPEIEKSQTIIENPIFSLGHIAGGRESEIKEINRIRSCKHLKPCGCGSK